MTKETLKDLKTVDLKTLTLLKRCDSDDLKALAPTFKRGDAVKVARRMNCSLPGSAKRNDIPVGTPATVVGIPDATSDKVIIKVLVPLERDAAPVEVTHVAFTDFLKFEHEDLEPNDETSKTLEEAEPSHGRSKKRAAPWALLDSVPEQVLEEPHWPKLLADRGSLIQSFCVRSRIGIVLQALVEALPLYTPKDLAVIERQNAHGVWRSELWTKKGLRPSGTHRCSQLLAAQRDSRHVRS